MATVADVVDRARDGAILVVAASPDDRGDLLDALGRDHAVDRLRFANGRQEIHYVGGGQLLLVPLRGDGWHALSCLHSVADVYCVVERMTLDLLERFTPVVTTAGGQVHTLQV